VVHLTTAANGAEAFFTDANNQARREDLTEARRVDDNIRAAWKDHPHVKVVDNATGFEEKIDRVFDFISNQVMQRLGRTPTRHVAALQDPDKMALQRYCVTKGSVFEIWPQLELETPSVLTYTFLSGSTDRILRRRCRAQTTSYILSTRDASAAQTTRTQRLSRQVYTNFLSEADPALATLEIRRYTLVFSGVHLTVDVVVAPQRLQTISFSASDAPVEGFEGWMAALALREVSADVAYSKRGLAQQGCQSAAQ